MTPAERRVLDLSVQVMERTGGLDIRSGPGVSALVALEAAWGAAVRDLMTERAETEAMMAELNVPVALRGHVEPQAMAHAVTEFNKTRDRIEEP